MRPARSGGPCAARRGMIRRAALVVSAVLLTGAIGLAVWSFVSNRGAGGSASAQAPAPTLLPEGLPDQTGTIAATNESPNAGQVEELLGGSLGASDKGRLEFVDKTGRVERELLYDRLEPREGGRVEVTNPQAWILLASGAVAHLTAQHGSLLQPPGQSEPQSGRFQGDVRLKLYDTDPRHAGEDAEPAPSLLVSTDSLNFDSAAGEARTDDRVRINAAGVRVEFTGFRIVIDDAKNRLALFQTHSAGSAVIDPAAMRRARAGKEATGASGANRAPGAAPVEALYRAVLTGDVRVASGARSASAGRMDLWTRLLDGRPTAATLAGLRALGSSTSSDGSGSDGSEDAPGAASVTGEAPARDTDAPITLAWSEGLTIRALDESPGELSGEDALARLAAPDGGKVRLADESAGIETTSVGVDAGLARRRLAWSGLGPTGVIVRKAGAFEAITGRLELDLASGVARAPGAGEIHTLADDRAGEGPPRRPRITWRQGADLTLEHTDAGVDFSARPILKTADFRGAVEANDGPTRLTGDAVHTVFGANPAGETVISRAIVTGDARVDAGPDGALAADRLDIEFDTSAAGPASPTVATAQGRVRAEQEGSTLRADLAEAHLRRAPGGRLLVESFTADLGVRVRTASGVTAEAMKLRATPETGLVDLTGEPARVALESTTVTGASIRIEQSARRLTVFGPGTLERAGADAPLGYQRMRLRWADSFVYDDVVGRGDAQGECMVTADISDLARDVVSAARVRIETTPADARAKGAAPAILRATALGGGGGTNPRDPARVESRRYITDDAVEGGLSLTRLVSLESPVIEADVSENRLRAPRPGRLVIEDRRDAAEDSASATRARGTTLIEWEGWFDLRRNDGAAEFRRQVRVRHRPPSSPSVTDLECERLEISFDPKRDDADSAAPGDVLWGQASGAVYVAQGRRQAIADRLLYDGSLGFAELTAWPGNVVMLYDADVPTPLSGDLLRWDLLRDRVQWRGARPVAAPD